MDAEVPTWGVRGELGQITLWSSGIPIDGPRFYVMGISIAMFDCGRATW